MKKYLVLFYDVAHSPDDDGYYAEVWNRDGAEKHVTNLCQSAEEAERKAKQWIDWYFS